MVKHDGDMFCESPVWYTNALGFQNPLKLFDLIICFLQNLRRCKKLLRIKKFMACWSEDSKDFGRFKRTNEVRNKKIWLLEMPSDWLPVIALIVNMGPFIGFHSVAESCCDSLRNTTIVHSLVTWIYIYISLTQDLEDCVRHICNKYVDQVKLGESMST